MASTDGKDSSHFDMAAWITALATFALLVAAIIVAVVESRRHRFARSIDLILQFDENFNGGEFSAMALRLTQVRYKNGRV